MWLDKDRNRHDDRKRQLNHRKGDQAAPEIGIEVFTAIGMQKLQALQIGEGMYAGM